MGQLKSMELPESSIRPVADASAFRASKSRWWLWVLIVGAIAIGVWYFRGSRVASEAANSAGPAAAGKGRGGPGMGNFVVPVVVATAQRGDLPVYFNGLGTVTAFNTVTVRSRVDGQLVSVAFREGQFVHEGDLLAQIDPRPFEVQLAQAEGQLARDLAQLTDARINLARYRELLARQLISRQQVDDQAATAGQYEGAVKTDRAL